MRPSTESVQELLPCSSRRDVVVPAAVQRVLLLEDRLAVVRDEHGDAGDVGRAEGPRDRQPQAP